MSADPVILTFSDGTTMVVADQVSMERMALAVERAIRGIRSVVPFREGEVALGLRRRYFLPVLWLMHQEMGTAQMADSFEFMGAKIFCLDD